MKVGIIGCGRIAQVRHIPEFYENKDATIAGYFDFVKERAEEMAENYGGKVYAGVEELLNDPEIDSVSICTSNETHAKYAISALEHGKNVLCEKPMALTAEECEAMVETAERTGKKLVIAQNQRFDYLNMKAKEILGTGVLGKINSFESSFGGPGPENWSVDKGVNNWFFSKEKNPMGVVADLGIHKIDLIAYLLNSDFVKATVNAPTLDKPCEVPDHAIFILEMKNGAVGTVTVSWIYYGTGADYTNLYGQKGSMKITGGEGIEVFDKEGNSTFYPCEDQDSSGIIDAFVDAVVYNKTVSCEGKNILPSMKIIYRSMK